MNTSAIKKPIGMQPLVEFVESICQKAPLYRRCGLKPEHLIVPLDPGEGRTTALEYVSDSFRAHGILNFHSGLDQYLDFLLDGSPSQLMKTIEQVRSAAVYENEYHGVIGMDASKMAQHLNETQFSQFLEFIEKIGRHAWVMFFMSGEPSKNEIKVYEKLCAVLGKVKRLPYHAYTQEELACIIEKSIRDHGVQIENDADGELHLALKNLIAEQEVRRVQKALDIAEELLSYGDFSRFTPIFTPLDVITYIKKEDNKGVCHEK